METLHLYFVEGFLPLTGLIPLRFFGSAQNDMWGRWISKKDRKAICRNMKKQPKETPSAVSLFLIEKCELLSVLGAEAEHEKDVGNAQDEEDGPDEKQGNVVRRLAHTEEKNSLEDHLSYGTNGAHAASVAGRDP